MKCRRGRQTAMISIATVFYWRSTKNFGEFPVFRLSRRTQLYQTVSYILRNIAMTWLENILIFDVKKSPFLTPLRPYISSLQINHHVPSSLNYTVDKLHVKFVLIRTVGNIHHAIRFAWQAEKRQAQFMSRGVGEKAAKNLRDSEQREARMVSTSYVGGACRW